MCMLLSVCIAWFVVFMYSECRINVSMKESLQFEHNCTAMTMQMDIAAVYLKY